MGNEKEGEFSKTILEFYIILDALSLSRAEMNSETTAETCKTRKEKRAQAVYAFTAVIVIHNAKNRGCADDKTSKHSRNLQKFEQ